METSLRLKPDDARTCFYLALAHEGLARPEAARSLYEKAIALEMKQKRPSAETHVAYGRLLFSAGDMDASQKQIARALEIDPRSRDAHYEQGRLHFERREYERAAAAGERALALPGIGTTERQIHFLLARAYGRLGNKERADAHLAKFKAAGVSLRR